MDQLAGLDPKAKSSTGLGPAMFLRHPTFKEQSYRVWGQPKATCAVQVSSKFQVLQPPTKATAHSKPFITDFNMSDMEVQLHCSNIILSYQDWFLGSVLQLSEQLQATTREYTLMRKLLHDLQEFVFSASRAGYNAHEHVCHFFNTILHRRDACLSDTFQRLQAPLKKQLRAHIPWMTTFCSTNLHVTLLSKGSHKPQMSPCFLRLPEPLTTLLDYLIPLLGTANLSRNCTDSLTCPWPPLANNIRPLEARTALSPSLPPRRGGEQQ